MRPTNGQHRPSLLVYVFVHVPDLMWALCEYLKGKMLALKHCFNLKSS